MSLYQKIVNREEKIAVIGLGYVGMPLAIAFANKAKVIGFDISEEKVRLYRDGIDPTNEVGNKAIEKSTVEFTSESTDLQYAKFYIVAVPTPINSDKSPDLKPVEDASELIGKNMKKGSIVVFESTVYPGVTEDICIPILEKASGLKCGTDFKVGYSPERINPGDKVNTLEKITKIVAGTDHESLEEISLIYELVIKAGIHKASSIKVAEAAKVVENSQRDINIAFMNELAIVFDRMDINSKDVVEAMNTKWNALKFYPGLVGGHCISVDPYYFVYKAEKLGYHSQIVSSGRKINDSMGEFVAEAIIKKLILTNKIVKQSNVVILGVTFKENCPDSRNSKVFDIISKLKEYGIYPKVVDPQADERELERHYGLKLTKLDEIQDADCLVYAVGHEEFRSTPIEDVGKFFKKGPVENNVIIDVKSIINGEEAKELGYTYWSL